MPPQPFLKVDHYDDISPLWDEYYNEPVFSPEFTEDGFEEEYSSAYLRVYECLEAAEAAMSGLAEEAFSMGPEFAPSRSLGIVVQHPDLLNTELLHRLWTILKEIPEDYVLTIHGSDRAGDQYYIALTKEKVVGHEVRPGALAPLGFE